MNDFPIYDIISDKRPSPVQTAQTPRKLNVYGVLFFWWVVWSFLALKDVTDPSNLTMLWMI
jgi:hypothetical protein